MSDHPDNKPKPSSDVVQFPYSRVRPPRKGEPARDLGPGLMAGVLGMPREQMTGHYCSRCNGIWYGFLLEVTCPACGSRHG